MRSLIVVQVRVVLVEDRTRVGEVDAVGRGLRPRQLDHPVEVGAHHVRLGPVGVHALQAAQLAHGLGERLLGQLRLLDLRAVLLRLLDARVALAELGLDRAQLLAQVVLALTARHLVLRLGLDLGLDRGDVELAAQQRVHPAQPRERIRDLEHLLGLGEPQPQIGRDQVGEPPRLADVRGDREHLGRQVLERQQLLDARAHRAHQRLALDAPLRLVVRGKRRRRAPEGARVLDEGIDRGAREALHQHLHAAVGHPQGAHHHHDGADAVEIVGRRGRRSRDRAGRPASAGGRPPARRRPRRSSARAPRRAAAPCRGRPPSLAAAERAARRGW